MDLIKEEKILSSLKTVRNTWKNAELFKTSEEARQAGYGLMYDDREGCVWGIRKEANSWERIAFVPYEGYYEKYETMATVKVSLNEKKVYELVDSAVKDVFLKCQAEAGIEDGGLDPYVEVGVDESQLKLTKAIIGALTWQLAMNKGVNITTEPKNTRINYLYRDAHNYKMRNSCVINGRLTNEQKETILNCLDGGEYFVPSLVGLSEENLKDETDADNGFFELTEEDFEETTDEPTVRISADELVESFKQSKDNWEVSVYLHPRGKGR